VLFQKFEVTRPGGYLTLANFLDHADFVGLTRGELTRGIDGLVRRGFLRPVRVPRDAFELTDAGAEAL
jgi:DNA-binding MarR family transcriptional regulator